VHPPVWFVTICDPEVSAMIPVWVFEPIGGPLPRGSSTVTRRAAGRRRGENFVLPGNPQTV
jgi:hypothetical protein